MFVEALLMAGVGVAIGTVLGIGFGWASAHAMLGHDAPRIPGTNVLRLGAALALLTVTALVSTYLPTRSAGRLSPTAALTGSPR